jgi:hypothetical protein
MGKVAAVAKTARKKGNVAKAGDGVGADRVVTHKSFRSPKYFFIMDSVLEKYENYWQDTICPM